MSNTKQMFSIGKLGTTALSLGLGMGVGFGIESSKTKPQVKWSLGTDYVVTTQMKSNLFYSVNWDEVKISECSLTLIEKGQFRTKKLILDTNSELTIKGSHSIFFDSGEKSIGSHYHTLHGPGEWQNVDITVAGDHTEI